MRDEGSNADSGRPPDEAWWERELHRNEKMVDRYLQALPETPGMFDEAKLTSDVVEELLGEEDSFSREVFSPDFEPSESVREGDEIGSSGEDEHADELIGSQQDEEDYKRIADPAQEFAVRVMKLSGRREVSEILVLSAGKIGVNLAGGHGLGYDEDALCGNIVKCRWALADSQFCLEMLEQLHSRTGYAEYLALADEVRALGRLIRQRVEHLRARVWW